MNQRQVATSTNLRVHVTGCDPHDATSAQQPVPDFADGLLAASQLPSRPLEGKRIGIIQQTMGSGVEQGVLDAVEKAFKHLESLGADVTEVTCLMQTTATPCYLQESNG